MQKVKIYYSVLQYVPSEIRQERLNVGIAFHVPNLQIAKFVYINDINRLATFDKEWDEEFYAITMQALAEDISSKSTSQEDELLIVESDEYLKAKTEYLANEFQFRDVAILVSDKENIEADIARLAQVFL